MQSIRTLALLSVLSLAAVAMPLGGCEKKAEPAPTTKPAAGTGKPAKADDHAHKDGDGHDHDQDKAKPAAKKDADSHEGHDHGGGHGGAVIALGEQTIGPFNVKATRDEGQIVPGKDAPIDATITAAAGATAKAVAVRFWIGTQDAKGSVKAKAEIEDSHEPNRWHVHAEIPSPLPAGSKLWIEIESDKGEKSVVGFDLKS